MVSASYDVIIVGGGISGLFAAREILKKHPTWRVAIAEKYKTLGGRTSTYHHGNLQWEAGAGRILESHTHVMKLLKEYGLTWSPIGTEIAFKPVNQPLVPNRFEKLFIPLYLNVLSKLSPKILANNTIEQLMKQIYGQKFATEILHLFPYRSEVNTLRADLALQTFLKGEMSTHEGYGIVAEGFSALVNALRADVEARGCIVLPRHTLINIAKVSGLPTKTDCIFRFGREKTVEPTGIITLRAERACLLTLCRCHVAALPFMRNVPALRYVIGRPLLRIYMVFPTKDVWFKGLPSVVTPLRPRYILPISVEKGVIMISYTDAEDTEFYSRVLKERGDAALEAVVLADVRRVFPEYKIPRPTFTKAHYWGTGASYWLPGSYDPEVESMKAMRPLESFKGLYMCGESWSLRQAWVEGALEHTQKCLALSNLS